MYFFLTPTYKQTHKYVNMNKMNSFSQKVGSEFLLAIPGVYLVKNPSDDQRAVTEYFDSF